MSFVFILVGLLATAIVVGGILFLKHDILGAEVELQDEKLILDKDTSVPYQNISDIYSRTGHRSWRRIMKIYTKDKIHSYTKNKLLFVKDSPLWKHFEKQITQENITVEFEDYIAHIDSIYVYFKNKWDNKVYKFTSTQFSITDETSYWSSNKCSVSNTEYNLEIKGLSLNTEDKDDYSFKARVFSSILIKMSQN